jgi:hypothetical protein
MVIYSCGLGWFRPARGRPELPFIISPRPELSVLLSPKPSLPGRKCTESACMGIENCVGSLRNIYVLTKKIIFSKLVHLSPTCRR